MCVVAGWRDGLATWKFCYLIRPQSYTPDFQRLTSSSFEPSSWLSSSPQHASSSAISSKVHRRQSSASPKRHNKTKKTSLHLFVCVMSCFTPLTNSNVIHTLLHPAETWWTRLQVHTRYVVVTRNRNKRFMSDHSNKRIINARRQKQERDGKSGDHKREESRDFWDFHQTPPSIVHVCKKTCAVKIFSRKQYKLDALP